MTTSLPLERFLERLTQSDTLSVNDAYENVGWFRRACDIRSEAVRAFPFDVIQNGKVLFTEDRVQDQDDETVEVIDRPDEIDIFNLLDDIVLDLDAHGAFYALYETNRTGRNGAWRRLSPLTIKPKFGREGLEYFERNLNGKMERYAPDELLYLWMPNREYEDGPGQGATESALLAATGLHNVERFQNAFFENGALNPTIIAMEGFDNATPDERDRVRSSLQKLMTGIKNAFNVVAVGGKTNAVNLMQPLTEMAMDKLVTVHRETIATSLGVPHSLLMSNASNFAVATQDDLNFYDKAIIPLTALIEQQLNERLFIPAGYLLRFRKSRLDVFQQLEEKKSEYLLNLFSRGIIDRNEVRAELGFTVDEMPDEPDTEDEQQQEDDNQPDNIVRVYPPDWKLPEKALTVGELDKARVILGWEHDRVLDVYTQYLETA